jgi:glycosyltransferase involved in cell wall biosynthesis
MKVSVVIPAFNEENNILPLAKQLKDVLPDTFEVLFVDDGSTDSTLDVLKQLHQEDNRFRYLSFSRNFGHQNAIKCGIDYATGECIITMDADLQHPPSLIPEMISKWKEGYDIVYTQRLEEKEISFFKRCSSSFFYSIMNKLSDVKLDPGSADFRLVDQRVAEIIRNTNESNLFIRGFVSWMGFRQHRITYHAASRHSGKTKYSFRKMISFALNGITSFSIKPLRFSIVMGMLISFFAFIYAMYAVVLYMFFPEHAVAGWASVLVSVLFMGGIQLLFLGVLGEYLGKLFMQSKNRPTYIVKEKSLHD